jgi:hypothetical protein
VTRERWLAAAGVVAVLASAPFLGAAPRVVFTNEGLVIDHPGRQAGAAAGLAGGLLLLGLGLRPRFVRFALLGAAGGGIALAGQLGVSRLAAGKDGLESRGLLSRERIGWGEVVGVDTGPAAILVRGPSQRAIRIESRAMSPQDRAMLERMIARRVREASDRAPAGR